MNMIDVVMIMIVIMIIMIVIIIIIIFIIIIIIIVIFTLLPFSMMFGGLKSGGGSTTETDGPEIFSSIHIFIIYYSPKYSSYIYFSYMYNRQSSYMCFHHIFHSFIFRPEVLPSYSSSSSS